MTRPGASRPSWPSWWRDVDDLTITVKHLQRGQPGPYRPHTYTSEITITGNRSWDHLLDGQIKDLVKAVVHSFTEEPVTDQGSYYRPRLTELVKVGEQKLDDQKLGPQREVWRATVEIPFTD